MTHAVLRVGRDRKTALRDLCHTAKLDLEVAVAHRALQMIAGIAVTLYGSRHDRR